MSSKRAFTFSQLALILLALLILVGLIMIVILQKDKIVEVINNVFGAGEQATESLDDAIKDFLMIIPIGLWRAKKQLAK